MTKNEVRALIIEDERSWQQILHEILTDAGMVVDKADNLKSALSLIQSRPHRLAIVDLSLNGDDPHNQDGLKIMETLEKVDPECMKLLLTGFATVEVAVSVLKDYGAYTCLRKETFNRAQFRELIQQALTSGGKTKGNKLDKEVGQEFELDITPESGQTSNGNVLVAEDDAGWRGILSELLTDNGYQVCLCTSFGEALGHLRREKFDIALVDLSLTGGKINVNEWDHPLTAQDLEGYRLLTSTRAKGIPTIVVSGVATPKDIEKTYQEQGIFAFMEKQSFNRNSFVETIKAAQQTARARSELDVLTEREREVLDLLSQGMTNKEIAETLYISGNTVKRHLKAIFEKLDIHTRSAAAAKALGASSGMTTSD